MGVRNACDQLDEAISATRYGLFSTARAQAAPRSKQRHEAGVRGLSEFPSEDQLDPPSPAPWRCFDLGAACARVAEKSPWRVALIASSSWSHAFLTRKHYLLYPDIDADRALYNALQVGDYAAWRERPLSAVEDSGQQEILNWMCLMGGMKELGRRPSETSYVESWIFNSNKCFAVYPPS